MVLIVYYYTLNKSGFKRIVFDGDTYSAVPIEVDGFEATPAHRLAQYENC